MKIRLASDLQRDSIVDGAGIRTVIWTQGCAHKCPGCHNPGTHDFNGGFEVDIEEIEDEISSLEGQQGITFSGGDPVYQIDAVIELSKYIKKCNLDIWVYTGFTYEQIIDMPRGKELLKNIDCLVDGPFILAKRTLDAPFRGSTNQRIIDTKKSLEENRLVLKEELMRVRDTSPLRKKDPKIYI